jgi:hypothetical protein
VQERQGRALGEACAAGGHLTGTVRIGESGDPAASRSSILHSNIHGIGTLILCHISSHFSLLARNAKLIDGCMNAEILVV